MNQTSTAAAIATMIAAYTGLFAMVGLLIFVTRPSAPTPRSRPRPSTPVHDTAAPDEIPAPRRAADDVVHSG